MNPNTGDIKEFKELAELDSSTPEEATEAINELSEQLKDQDYSVKLDKSEANYLLSLPKGERVEAIAWYRSRKKFNKRINNLNIAGFSKDAFLEGFRSARVMFEQESK